MIAVPPPESNPLRRVARCLGIAMLAPFVLAIAACGDDASSHAVDAPPVARETPEPERAEAGETSPATPPAPVMHQPVPRWNEGRTDGQIDAASAEAEGYVLLDLGDDWTPFIFSESDTPDGPRVPQPYRATYLALARGEYPDDYHGERAREDKYLELYGIPPTLTLLRTRMEDLAGRACVQSLDLEPLRTFQGTIVYDDPRRAVANARRYEQASHLVERLMHAQNAADAGALDTSALSRAEQDLVRDYQRFGAAYHAVAAAQARLACEGYLEGKGRYVRGALDWPTHEALAEFERRHRIFGWGFVGRDTLEELRRPTLEGERESIIRVLTERAMHAAAVIEDGSTDRLPDGRPNTFVGPDGRTHAVPNFARALRERVIAAFGLDSPDATLAFLRGLGDLAGDVVVAIPGVERPAYYGPDMDFSVEIDRGDVWYEFPYDEHGAERPQGVERRPQLTLFVDYRGQRIPLARFGTTIGGWRSEQVGEILMWKYKGSPPGAVVWERIVASPVWLPPDTAPPRSLLVRGTGSGRDRWRVNRHEMGPSYASAYGLVAAYHRPYVRDASGRIDLRGDQGIRTHGSVDYMSIMRRHSHGCHRLHNHIAVRLMSFVLRHRAYVREGEDEVAYRRNVVQDGYTYSVAVDQGGYEFSLVRPIPVTVLPGRILGEVTSPIEAALPRFDPAVGAYVVDGGAVTVDRYGRMTSIPWPLDGGLDGGLDAGALDGGVPAATNLIEPARAVDAGVAHAPDAH